jgi:hypothetical protein
MTDFTCAIDSSAVASARYNLDDKLIPDAEACTSTLKNIKKQRMGLHSGTRCVEPTGDGGEGCQQGFSLGDPLG